MTSGINKYVIDDDFDILEEVVKAYKQGKRDAEPHWTPCSERMPDEKMDVILQFEKNMCVGFLQYGYWFINSGNGWYTDVNECDEKPIAWMPLPEPAKLKAI